MGDERPDERLKQMARVVEADTPVSMSNLDAVYRALPEAPLVYMQGRGGMGESETAAAEIEAADKDNIPLALVGWVAGCTVIWSSLFAIGNFLYGRTALALTLTAVFALSGSVLLYVINTLWDRPAVPRAGAVR